MGIVAPPNKVTKQKNQVNAKGRGFLNECLASVMREMVQTEDGRFITKAQAVAERLSNIAMFAESNTDSIAASKFIYERLGGKASVMKDNEVRPMPKVVITLNDDGIKKVADSPNHADPYPEKEDDGLIRAIIGDSEYVDEPVGELDD